MGFYPSDDEHRQTEAEDEYNRALRRVQMMYDIVLMFLSGLFVVKMLSGLH